MLVHHLLLSFAVDHHHEGIEPTDFPPDLEAVDQKDGGPHPAAAQFGQEQVL